MVNGPGSARRLLGVFAHPDDEVFCAGGTIARAADAGAEVMIVSASRGEQGQIRDPTAATRRTLGAVRERELWAAAAQLGAQHAQVLAYPDGNLQHYRSSLGDAIADIMRQFDPDTVVTFGADGGYGHPDHIAVSELTTATFRGLVRHHNRGQRLYHAVFPPTTDLHGRGTGALDHQLRAADHRPRRVTGHHTVRERVDHDATGPRRRASGVVSPGIGVIEQGEPTDALYLILNGTADALLEQPDGQLTRLRRMEAGDFFGELGLVEGK